MTKRIGDIAKKHPAIARMVEISFYWAVLSVLQYIGWALTTNSFSDYKVALGMMITWFVAWIVSWLQKIVREKKDKLEED